jgi:gluconate kinase
MKYFVIIRGPLGCGKSTTSETVSTAINGKHIEIDKVLEDMRLDFRPPGNDSIPAKHFIKVNDYIIEEAKASKKPMVLDACFYHKSVIEDLLKRMPSKGYVFTLKAPLEVCVDRDSKREKSHGAGAATAVHNLVSRFDYGINIDATRPLETNVQEIVSQLPA